MSSNTEIIKNDSIEKNDDAKYLKLDSRLRNNLLKKLNELVNNNEIIKNETADQKEINDLISDLNKIELDSKDQFDNNLIAEKKIKLNDDNLNQSHALILRELTIPNLEKFIANMDLILAKLKPFDPKTNNLTSWFLMYDIYSDIYNWSDSERIFGLTYFFDSGLNKLIFLQKEYKYLEIKQNLVNFVYTITNLNGLPFIRHEQIQLKMELFNEYAFSTYERMYWFNCYFPLEKIKEFYNSSNAYDQTWEKSFFNQII